MNDSLVQLPTVRQDRIAAVDIARAAALVGMILAHLYSPHGVLGEITAGFPSALFALLSGVSLGIMDQSAQEKNTPVLIFRQQMVLRGILLLLVGALLEPFSAGIDIVLFSIGAVYIVLPYTLRFSFSALLRLTVMLAVLSAVIYLLLSFGLIPYRDLFGGSYPVCAWATYALCGVLFYRRFLAGGRPASGDRLRLLLLTILCGVIAVSGIIHRTWVPYGMPYWLIRVLSFEAHTGSLGDIVLTLAGSLCTLGLLTLLFSNRMLARFFFPVQALGSMSLTAYIAHILSAGAVISSVSAIRYEQATWATIIFSLLLATIIKYFFSQGPAEYLMAQSVKKLTSTQN